MPEAIEKIKAEMDGNKNNPYIQVVGNFLLRHLETDPGAAEKIMAEGKTIAKSLGEMRKEAEKKKVDNMAVLTDAEGFGIVLKYFGLEGAVPAQPVYQEPVRAAAPEPKQSDFSVSLDDLLGG